MPTTASRQEIRNDFDEIAHLIPKCDHLGPYEAWVLKQISGVTGTAAEVGCGVGQLARRLAGVFDNVVAVDLSDGMIAEARRRTRAAARIEYVSADLLEWLPRFTGAFDCIVSVGTLHHMDLAPALRAMAAALRPGGRLVVLDLCSRTALQHLPLNIVAWVAARLYEVIPYGGIAPWKLRRAYWCHGEKESYLTLSAVKKVVSDALPNATVRGHLMWRYSIVWDKPSK